jgi:hypothetical protein
MEDINKLLAELTASHREFQDQVVRIMERQSDLEAMAGRIEALTKQVVENNVRISRILEIHDFNIDELDARLKRLEQRRSGLQ